MFEPQLNPEQAKAVRHRKGPLLIVAGAGTGKTTVITERIVYLMSQLKVEPEAIVALTFTDKAAEEMLSRIDARMPLGYQEPWVSTFHAFCDRILRQEAFEVGLDPGFAILTQAQQWLLIRRNLYRFPLDYYRPLGNPTKFITALVTFFSRTKDELIEPPGLLEVVKRHQLKAKSAAAKEEAAKLWELAQAYQTYQELLLENNSLDFGDLILWVIKLFHEHSSVLKRYQKQIQYILVDEFQDTNVAQYELIKFLAPHQLNPNLTVVADDDQSIFRWRHASLYNTLEFRDDYPRAEVIPLTRNYRSRQKILDHAYQLIRFNDPDRLEVKLKIEKKLVSDRGEGQRPEVLWGKTVEAEVDLVLQRILKMIKNGYSFQDIAILARANHHLDPFVEACKKAQIPYSLVSNRGLFEQPEIKVLFNALKVIVDPEDSSAFFGVVKSSFFKINAKELTEVIKTNRRGDESLFDTATHLAGKGSFLYRLVKLFAQLHERSSRALASDLLYEFIVRSGLADQFLKDETLANQLRIRNLNIFYDRMRRFEREVENSSVWDFLDLWEQLLEAGEDPAQAEVEDVDTTKLLTVHSAKGLEFPVVFLVNLVCDRFPTRYRGEVLPLPEELVKEGPEKPQAHLQEERRLFYVGTTRARDYLFLTGADTYTGVREKTPSKFLTEFLGKDPKGEAQTRQVGLFSQALISLPTGRSELPISHPQVRSWSYSRIETYLTCPLKYYYRYVLQFPGKPSPALSFGQVIHSALKAFHQPDLLGKRKKLVDLLSLYEDYFKAILGKPTLSGHREEQFKKGKKFLTRYHKVYRKVLGEPLELEKEFQVKIGRFTLKGRIDRIDRRPDGTIELVDYKVSDQERLGQRVDKDRQLTTYALGAQKGLGIQVASLSLYSVVDNRRVGTRRTPEEIDAFEKKLVETIEEITKSEYPPKVSISCQWCDYRLICPAYRVSQKIS